MKTTDILTFLAETNSTPIVAVDIQPTYSGIYDGEENPIFQAAIEFVNKSSGKVLMLVNAEDQGLTSDTVQDIKTYWEDCGFDHNNWARVKVYDKGYGYLRAWMDGGISEATIIRVIRYMYQKKVSDSRDLEVEDLKKIVGNEWQDWLENDHLTVNWIEIGTLKQYNNCYMIGGARDECLKEVRLLMSAFNIRARLIDDFIYG